MEDQALPKLLSAKEVSEMLGVAQWRIYERVRTGDLPSVKVGRSVRFSASALREWIEQGGTREEG